MKNVLPNPHAEVQERSRSQSTGKLVVALASDVLSRAEVLLLDLPYNTSYHIWVVGGEGITITVSILQILVGYYHKV